MLMKEKLLITIGRQFGSGGKCIAEGLGEKLGLPVYDKELLYIAAKESGIAPELFESADEKSSKSLFGTLFGISTVNPGDPVIPMGGYLNNDKLFEIQSKTILDIASQGSAIFIGRCADYILRESSELISFFICAHLQERIERVSGEMSISFSDAESLIAKKDKKRSDYYNYYTFKKWGDASSYNISLNSSFLGLDGTVDLMRSIIEKL